MKKHTIDKYIFFLLPFFAAYFAALYLVISLQFVYLDALSRTFHAYTVFFGNEPKFANIGFVWPPVPTLAALPLILIKPLNLFGFAGNLLTAFFLGITCLFLNNLFKFFNLSLLMRVCLILLFIFNPMMIFYGANGMSEIIAISFFVAMLYYFFSYIKSENIGYLIGTSIAVSLAVMTRYEMAALIPIIMLLLIINKTRKIKKISRKLISVVERDLLLFGVPVIFTVAIWLFANWAIMHHPLHFMNSIYSNTSQASLLMNESSYFRGLNHNIVSSFLYVAHRVIILFPAYVIFSAVILTKVINRQNLTIGFAALSLPLSILLFHVYLLYNGQSYGWLRFFIYIIPSSFILCAFILSKYQNKKQYKFYTGIVLFLIIISSFSSYLTMSDPEFGKEEHRLVNAVTIHNGLGLDNDSYVKDLEIANYIKANVTEGKILVDDFTGFSIIYLSEKQNLFIETIDKEFQESLQNIKTDDRVQYLLVIRHGDGGIGDLDAINRMYPTMFDNGANIAVLVKDFGKWRLYKKINT